jgi:hypothetical protein
MLCECWNYPFVWTTVALGCVLYFPKLAVAPGLTVVALGAADFRCGLTVSKLCTVSMLCTVSDVD